MDNSQSELRKAVEEFEAGLITCGIDASNVDYDSLADVRSKLWGELDKIVEAKTTMPDHERWNCERLKALERRGSEEYTELSKAEALTPERVVAFINQLSPWNLKTSGMSVLQALVAREKHAVLDDLLDWQVLWESTHSEPFNWYGAVMSMLVMKVPQKPFVALPNKTPKQDLEV
jgi:hypothetical protein